MNSLTDDIVPSQLPVEEAPASEDAYTTLYVHVYPSALFAAHWSFFLPYQDPTPGMGDRIHVTGDRLNGFAYEYISGYDPKEDSRRPNAFPIGRVATKATQTTDGADERSVFDRLCQQVPAPGPGLNTASTGSGAPKRREVRDCQWWIKQAACHLVEQGVLLPLEDSSNHEDKPLARLDALPRH